MMWCCDAVVKHILDMPKSSSSSTSSSAVWWDGVMSMPNAVMLSRKWNGAGDHNDDDAIAINTSAALMLWYTSVLLVTASLNE